MTHDSIIIQIPALKSHRRNKLEQVLSVFESAKGKNKYINFENNEYPDEYDDVIRRLLQAASEPKIRERMILEEEIVQELTSLEREAADYKLTIVKKDRVIEEKDQVIEEKDQVIEEKDQALEEKDQVIEATTKVLADSMDISFEEARKIINKKLGIKPKKTEKMIKK